MIAFDNQPGMIGSIVVITGDIARSKLLGAYKARDGGLTAKVKITEASTMSCGGFFSWVSKLYFR